MTILLGIGGALISGFLGRSFGWYGEGDPVGFIMAVIGAILMLFAYRAQAPLIDELLKEIGIEPGKIAQLPSGILGTKAGKSDDSDQGGGGS